MGLVKGISELYVDIMLTLIVVSFSGVLLTLYSNVRNSFEVGFDEVKEVPTTLLINYRGRSYLIIVNHDLSTRKFVVVSGDVKLYEFFIMPQEVIAVDVGSDLTKDLLVVFEDYILRPNTVVLR